MLDCEKRGREPIVRSTRRAVPAIGSRPLIPAQALWSENARDYRMNDTLIRSIFLTHVAATMFMTGVIWFVQIVHYPLFSGVGKAEFSAYEQRHTALTTWVVAPPMLIEALTALMLLWFRPQGVTAWQIWAGLFLLSSHLVVNRLGPGPLSHNIDERV